MFLFTSDSKEVTRVSQNKPFKNHFSRWGINAKLSWETSDRSWLFNKPPFWKCFLRLKKGPQDHLPSPQLPLRNSAWCCCAVPSYSSSTPCFVWGLGMKGQAKSFAFSVWMSRSAAMLFSPRKGTVRLKCNTSAFPAPISTSLLQAFCWRALSALSISSCGSLLRGLPSSSIFLRSRQQHWAWNSAFCLIKIATT